MKLHHLKLQNKKKSDKARQTWKRKMARKERKVGVALPDRRVLEGKMHEMLRGPAEPLTPLHRAQELIYQAFDDDDPEKRCQLAQQALALSPDCADAYVLLAEHAHSRTEALDLYAKGVEAGERALGAEKFAMNAGHFWGILETRPYMRARAGLARLLWTSGQRQEAVGHLQDMLRLNPNDKVAKNVFRSVKLMRGTPQ